MLHWQCTHYSLLVWVNHTWMPSVLLSSEIRQQRSFKSVSWILPTRRNLNISLKILVQPVPILLGPIGPEGMKRTVHVTMLPWDKKNRKPWRLKQMSAILPCQSCSPGSISVPLTWSWIAKGDPLSLPTDQLSVPSACGSCSGGLMNHTTMCL